MTPPTPAALARHASKRAKHNSAGPLVGLTNSPNNGGGPGSTGLLVGSGRPSRALSPLQTQSQPAGVAGSPMLLTSSSNAVMPPAGNTVQQQQHPYAAALMHPHSAYARNPGAPGPGDGPYGPTSTPPNGNGYGGVPGNRNSIGMGSRQASMNYGSNGRAAPGYGANQMQRGTPEERELPAPPKTLTLWDILRCQCG